MTRIAAYLWPKMTLLDVLGPLQILGFVPEFEVVTVATTAEPVVGDTGVPVVPDHDLTSCPPVDVLFTGGGADPSEQMRDPAVLDWLRAAGTQASHVTSVCTGALILAEAGLLDEYRATTHWAYLDDLRRYPNVEVVEDERVVIDRNRVTGGGVTAGIDFAFALITELVGADTAAALQLRVEYDPQPPTPFGHPRDAPAELVAALRSQMAGRPSRVAMDAFFAEKAAT